MLTHTYLDEKLQPQGQSDNVDLYLRQTRIVVTDIWQKIFSLDEINDEDDFFNLGGDSLKAMELFDSIESNCGVRLSIPVLLQHTTLSSLIAEVSRRPTRNDQNSLVVLNEKGNRCPIFAFDTSGNILYYARLSRALGEDQPFYAFQSFGNDLAKKYSTVSEMALAFLKLLKEVRPFGPYILAGMCRGTTIAVEAARHLEHEQTPVEALILFDTTPGWLPSNRYAYSFKHVCFGLTYKFFRPMLNQQAKERFDKIKQKHQNKKFDKNKSRSVFQVSETPKLSSNLLFVRSGEFENRPDKTKYLHRARALAAKSMEILEMPGGHTEQFQQPNVDMLARKLEAYLSTLR